MLTKNQGPGSILIYKDKGKPGVRVAAELQKSAKSQHLKIITATGLEKLRQMLKNNTFDAVIIDVGREIGDTLGALRILKGVPAIPLFIFNGFLLPRIEEKAREYSQIHYFENHNAVGNFVSVILAAIHNKKLNVNQGISLVQFLQLMKIEKWSGQVTVTARGDQGILLLQDGRLLSVAAEELAGRIAWKKMAAWENIVVETSAGRFPANLTGGKLPASTQAPNGSHYPPPSQETEQPVAGSIESLQLIRKNTKIALNLKKLNLGVFEIREILSTSLLRTDIFLSNNSRSLAGWNSTPLACSQFAAITRSLINSLQISGLPPLGEYYLLDLDADHLVFVVVKGELQWGFLLKGTKERLGLLLNIVLPKAARALEEAVVVENNA
jgi:hypothetical protein